MKTFRLLLALFAVSAAAADKIPTLRVDLDGDGVMDVVQILPLDAQFNRLQVKLSRSGQIYSYDRLVRIALGPDAEGSCSGVTQQSLRRGAAGSFVWSETVSDLGYCSGQLARELQVRVGRTGLVVNAIRVNSQSHSNGDPSPFFDARFDLAARTVKMSSFDDHFPTGIDRTSQALPASCGEISLADFEREEYPACIQAAAKRLNFDCGRNEQSTACPVPYDPNQFKN